ncbi:RagB/SusD family nutrient uptake outer membrane protein [Mariniphaga sediminis]|uniref:RagB/SusD family nutrient uptake outer membrane protein n=1 Tax=Mariniphaga sediminis TaxID=1628158 RepID=A0A399CWW1_9BACT|nr:RagB/SusD family nutrient uptake outer membrane protein [Mariniphaga sediminis]RIH63663.1 RagB/SusD family nutrient uptake outer membrane protein [Mariniphaga sediminis]
MKNNLFIIIISVCFVGLVGCMDFGDDFLEKPPSVDITKDTIFSKLEYAERFLWDAYKTLPYGMPTNWGEGLIMGGDILASITDINQSDIPWAAGKTTYYNGAYQPSFENAAYWAKGTKYNFTKLKYAWKGIRTSYIFIENIGSVPDADINTKKQLIAEARMIIAVHYTDMFRHLGGVPWLTHAYDVNEDTHKERLTSLATTDSIVAIIDKAIPDLPWVVNDPSNWEGRFTQAAALGLKARVLLFSASPLFNSNAPYLAGEASDAKLTWHGGENPELWQKAADTSHELIENVESKGGYGLVYSGNPRQDFQDAYFKRGNGEVLISSRIMYKPTNYNDPNYLPFQLIGWYGIGGPTYNYVEMFPMDNGKPITDPESGYDPENPLANRDPRLRETVLVDGDYYLGRTAEMWVGGIDRPTPDAANCATGFGWRKFGLDRTDATSGTAPTQWPYLRLAEVYLTYAEAANEVNNGPTPEAYRCINMVRNRVGLGDLPTGLSKEAFREAVLVERACEFGYEEVRWFDIIRWKKEEVFKKDITGLNIYRDPETGAKTYEVFDMPPRYWKTNFSPKWYLSAFAPNEIDKGYGLIQNPGWE